MLEKNSEMCVSMQVCPEVHIMTSKLLTAPLFTFGAKFSALI